jgi:hypothetical protein
MDVDDYRASDDLDNLLLTLAEAGSIDLILESRPGHHLLRTSMDGRIKNLARITAEQERALIAVLFQCVAHSMNEPFSQVRAGEKKLIRQLPGGIEVLIRFNVCPAYPAGFDLLCKVFKKA